jgi:hypothetical protein
MRVHMKYRKLSQRLVGAWIDHREAIIVFVSAGLAQFTRIASNIERQLRRVDPATNARIAVSAVKPDDRQDRAFAGHLLQYYAQVVAHFRHGDRILVLGPGEAKGELLKRLQENGFGEQVVGCFPAERLSPGQMEAKVRSYFFPISFEPTAPETSFHKHSSRSSHE